MSRARTWAVSAVVIGLVGLVGLHAQSTPWHLDRIDQRTLPLDGRYRPAGDGTGVHAYVIDSGIRKTHEAFGGRVDWVGDFVGGSPASTDANDCDIPQSQGHGTHVASILGGTGFGVAPGVRIHALRILPCTGTTRTDIDAAIRAVDWITAHGQKPAVVNISPARWQTKDARLDEAIARSIRAGFTYTLSAGGVDDIAAYTPQRAPGAITVGSIDRDDNATRSGYGPTLTLFAPGVGVAGAGNASDTASFAGDGDSFAAPIAAGAVAIYLQGHPQASPTEVRQAITSGATAHAVKQAGAAPDRLVYVGR